jgi:hypothetical protein
MPRVNRFLVVLGLVAFWGVAAGALAAVLAHFPETQRAIASPDKKYSIYNKNSDQEPNHSLYIRSNVSGGDEKILDYGRHVDVMWSPGSDAFFVNDYSGSSEATCLVYFADGLRRLDVKSLLNTIGEGEILSSDHLYITCKKWNKSGILVAVSGRGDKYPNGFDRKYSVNPRKQEMRRVS